MIKVQKLTITNMSKVIDDVLHHSERLKWPKIKIVYYICI